MVQVLVLDMTMTMMMELRKLSLEKNVFSHSLMMEHYTMTAQPKTSEISHGVQLKLALMTIVSLNGITAKPLAHLPQAALMHQLTAHLLTMIQMVTNIFIML